MRRSAAFVVSSLASVALLTACQQSAAPSAVTDDAASASSVSSVATVPFSGTHTTVDLSQSSIDFVGGSTIVDHPGRFTAFSATVTPDATSPSDATKAAIAVSIDIASVKTDADALDAHLQRDDFFAAATYPKATFVSTAITSLGNSMYSVTGDFTMKGVTKSMTVEAAITDSAITTKFDLPRKEFGIGNDSYGNKLLDEQIPVAVVLTLR